MDVWRVYVKQSARRPRWGGGPSLINHDISKMFSVVTPQAVGNKGKNRVTSQAGGQDGSSVQGLTDPESAPGSDLAHSKSGLVDLDLGRDVGHVTGCYRTPTGAHYRHAVPTYPVWEHAGSVENTGSIKVWSRDRSGVPKGVPWGGGSKPGRSHHSPRTFYSPSAGRASG